MEILIVSLGQTPAICTRLFERRRFLRNTILRRKRSPAFLDQLTLCGICGHALQGMMAVLISFERSISLRKTSSRLASGARPVMYSRQLKRPLVINSNALRAVAGV